MFPLSGKYKSSPKRSCLKAEVGIAGGSCNLLITAWFSSINQDLQLDYITHKKTLARGSRVNVAPLILRGDHAESTLVVNKYRTQVVQLTLQLSAERQVQMSKLLWRVGGQHKNGKLRVWCIFLVIRAENQERRT